MRTFTYINIHLYASYITCSKCPPFFWTQSTALFLICREIFRTRSLLVPDWTSSTITSKDSIVLGCLFFILTVTWFQTLKPNRNKSSEKGGQWWSVFIKIIWYPSSSLRKSRHRVVMWQLAPSSLNRYCRFVALFFIVVHICFQYFVQMHIAFTHHCLPTTPVFQPHHWKRTSVDNAHPCHNIFHTALSCVQPLHAEVSVLSIGHFANVEVILTQALVWLYHSFKPQFWKR